MLREATINTATVTSMVFVILLGAAVFSIVFRMMGGDNLVHEILTDLPGGAIGALIVVMLVMFLLGFILDTFEIIFIVIPITAPVLLNLGVDPLWLGVLVGVNLQTSFLTPPFGFSLFYLRGVAPAERDDRAYLPRGRALRRAAARRDRAAAGVPGAGDLAAEDALRLTRGITPDLAHLDVDDGVLATGGGAGILATRGACAARAPRACAEPCCDRHEQADHRAGEHRDQGQHQGEGRAEHDRGDGCGVHAIRRWRKGIIAGSSLREAFGRAGTSAGRTG